MPIVTEVAKNAVQVMRPAQHELAGEVSVRIEPAKRWSVVQEIMIVREERIAKISEPEPQCQLYGALLILDFLAPVLVGGS